MTELEKRLKEVAIIGAAGKMGSGIALLLLQEMAINALKSGEKEFLLNLIDADLSALILLRPYLRTNLTKYAEKNINLLRKCYEHDTSLVSNEEMVRAFVEKALDSVLLSSEIQLAKNSYLIFEAIVEKIEAKVALFQTLKEITIRDPWYFTNTSSIPVHLLASSSGARLIGFHFYNPPAVQKILEIVTPEGIDAELEKGALELSKKLQKMAVFSNDIAGFIGNGYLMREILFALAKVRELQQKEKLSLEEAIWVVDQVTHKYLLRPMGIFQLVDYVGIDVCTNIMKTMSRFSGGIHLTDTLLEEMLQFGIKGGHEPDGTQKPGFFSYRSHNIDGVYSIAKKHYLPVSSLCHLESFFPPVPQKLSWKSLQKDPDRDQKIEKYRRELKEMRQEAALLAQSFLFHLEEVITLLVSLRVVKNREDVLKVLKNGFFHLVFADEVKHDSI